MYHEYPNLKDSINRKHYNGIRLTSPKPQQFLVQRVDVFAAIIFLQAIHGPEWVENLFRKNGNAWKEAESIRIAARERAKD